MRKKVFKVFLLLNIIVLCTFSSTMSYTYASQLGDIVTGAQDFIEKGDPDKAIGEESIKKMSDILYNVLLVIAVLVAVGIGIYIGIQFMTGGIEQKAKIKETLIPYIAGCIVVFGAFTIWKLVVTILQSAG